MSVEPVSIDAAGEEQPCVRDIRPVELCGDIDASMDLSGAVVVGDFLVLGADEGHCLQILRRAADGQSWSLVHKVPMAESDQETDIEAITYGKGHLYVIGSHSMRRRRMRPDLTVRKNRERLLQTRRDASRNRLFRIPFDPGSGKAGRAEYIDLSKRLRKDPLLKAFQGIPGKENGIDIEGMAFRDGRLFLGFRGPVLRENHVPVMTFAFDRPKQYALSFVRLDGHGVRDMVALQQGFLILSGPVNDAPGPYRLWWWDGVDQIPGKDSEAKSMALLGAVSTRGGAKAEGLALLREGQREAQVLVVYETNTAAQAVSMWVDLQP